MPTIQIQEYGRVTRDTGFKSAPIAQEPALASQNFDFSSATQSAVFAPGTRFVRVVASAKVHLKFGENPTAAATDMWLMPNNPEYFGVEAGSKLSAYDGVS